MLRSQVIKVREFQHVVAARGIGASPSRLIFGHILPRVAPLGVAQFVRSATIAMLIESSLAFLGLGDPSRVSWGNTLFFANQRSAFITDAWLWWVLPPGLALTAAILGLAFVGYAVEEWSDPRLGATPRRRPRARRPARPEAADGIDQAPDTVLEVREVVIAMAIANEPRLIVADEPVTGLDVVTQVRILRLLVEVRDRLGVAMVLVSHDLPLVSRVASELVVMREGRIVEAGPAAAVTQRPEHPHTRALLAPLAAQENVA